ncbi:MAG: biotin-dependent carboxyltransferase family protein [Chloroflexi bacterium]|nr:biotin-dependent carboxyltransferase family protein [Chloroflexota bacterium]
MLEILEAGGLVTVQDAGRRGWQKFGVPVSGAMDWFAHRAANVLVGNPPDAATLEIGFGDVTLRALRDCVIAVTGAGFVTSTFAWTFPLWTSFVVHAGGTVRIMKEGDGNWAYLAIAGGIESESMLGSRSSYLRAGLGQKLEVGDRLNIGQPSRSLDELAARTFSPDKLPLYSSSPVIETLDGVQSNWFTKDGLETFYSSDFSISPSSDRMGFRMDGAPIARVHAAELLSEGMTIGSIQIPASGLPIVMMADSPTTGGYPKIANVVTADLPLLAQVPFREGRIRFKMTSVEEAQARYRKMTRALEDGIEEVENDAKFAQ